MNNIAQAWQRLLAYLIDIAVCLLLPIYLIYSFSLSPDLTTALNSGAFYLVILILVYPVADALFIAFLISSFGGTIGKLLTGTKIVSSDNKNVSFWRAFFRNHIGYMISGVFVWLGFIWILIDKEKRAWHDQIADTYVVVTSSIVSILGVLILAAIIFTEVTWVSKAVLNIQKNSFIYTDVYTTVIDSLKNTSSVSK